MLTEPDFSAKVIRIYTIIALYLGLSAQVIANTQTDSLKEALRAQPSVSEQIDIYTQLAREMTDNNPDSALFYAHRALDLSPESDNPLDKASALSRMGSAHFAKGNFEEALRLHIQALGIRSEAKDHEGKAGSELNIGNILLQTDKPEEALIHFQTALETLKKLDDPMALSDAHNNLGICFYYLSQYEPALTHYQQAFDLLVNASDAVRLASTLNNLGALYEALEDYNQALDHYSQSLRIYQASDDAYGVAMAYNNMGLMHEYNLSFDSAQSNYERALDIARSISSGHLELTVLENLYLLYETQANAHEALRYHLLHTELKDSLFTLESNEQILDMEAKYESEKKQREINAQQAEIAQKTNERNLLILSLVGLVLIAVTSMAWFRQRMAAREQLALKNEALAKKEVDDLLNQQEIQSIRAMLKGREDERKRVARELHDGIGSLLASTQLHFSILSKSTKTNPQEQASLTAASNLLNQSCNDVREIAHQMNSGTLQESGLTYALTQLCDAINASKHTEVQLMYHGFENRIDATTELNVYRIVQESLANVLRHAQAKHITVQLNRSVEQLNVMVEDDGVGFVFDRSKLAKGIGLDSIIKRVERMNGTITIDSKPGRGTTIVFDIPNEEA